MHPSKLESVLLAEQRVVLRDSFVSLEGYEYLLEKSRRRVASNRILNGKAMSVALDFTRDLVRICPFAECVAVSGSVASGGYSSTDDLDFDLFVRAGTKYASYLIATLVGLRYSWRFRHQRLSNIHQVLSIPKIVCINVVWSEDQTAPFVRQDADMAFELLRCHPVFGARVFQQVCADNSWALSYFPQLQDRRFTDTIEAEETPLRRLLGRIWKHPRLMRGVEIACRGLVWIVYHVVQWTRRRDPAALARMNFLKRVKWPYEVLQD